MPIGTGLANNLKVNNMMGNGPMTINTQDGPHQRDMSLDDDRGQRRQNINTAGMTNGNTKADIIASRIVNQSKSPDRYVINNNLVVNLNGTPGGDHL